MIREVPVRLLAAISICLIAFIAPAAVAENNRAGNVSAEGEITALGADTLTVGGVTFTITAETKIINGTRDDLAIGVEVAVKGKQQADGSIVAINIKIKDKPERIRIRNRMAIGIITDLVWDGDDVVAVMLDDEKIFDITPGQKVLGRHGLAATADNLHEGLTLHVRFKPHKETPESGALGLATSLRVRGKENIKGRIAEATSPALALPAITVGSETCYYDEITEVIGAAEEVSAPGDLTPGTAVHALSNPLADGSHLANKVVVDNASDRAGKLQRYKGVVNGVSRDGDTIISFTVNDETFLVDENTAFKVAGYDGPFPTGLFDIGLRVVVKAKPQSDDSLLALWVRVVLPIYIYCGEIESIGSDSLTIMGQTIAVTEYTVFAGFEADGTSLDDLAVGDKVEVKALAWPNGDLVAAAVKPCVDDIYHVRGTIDAIAPDGDDTLLTVAGVTVRVTSETVIADKDGTVAVGDLKTGMLIDAWGLAYDAGILEAGRIKIR